MAKKDITDRFVIAGRPGDRERVEVVVKERASRNKVKTSKFISKITRPDFTGSSNYRLPAADVALIRDLSRRLEKLMVRNEMLPWKRPSAFLIWVHAREFILDLMAMTVLDNDELLVEFRRMLFNFNSKYLAFRPNYKPAFAKRRRVKTW